MKHIDSDSAEAAFFPQILCIFEEINYIYRSTKNAMHSHKFFIRRQPFPWVSTVLATLFYSCF